MIAQFSVWPLDKPHLREEVAEMTQILKARNVHYEIGAVSTAVEGDWTEVISAIQACHEAMRGSHDRVLTSITIDDDVHRPQSLQAAKAKVAEGSRTV